MSRQADFFIGSGHWEAGLSESESSWRGVRGSQTTEQESACFPCWIPISVRN